MKLEIMETATKTAKPIWDSIVVTVGSIVVILQSAVATEVLVWAQVFAAIGVGTFALARAYWWYKNKGYKDSEKP